MIRKYDMSDIDYNEYREIQIARAKQKWYSARFWKCEYEKWAKRINETWDTIGIPKSICCMGIRSGNEYEAFHKIGTNNAEIYGIDIHPKVVEVGKNCYCYDFNELPEEWKDKFDFIFSNSIDHSYDLMKTFDEWYRVCSGHMFLTFSDAKVCASDIYSFKDINDIKELLENELKSRFELVKYWDDDGLSVLLKVIK